MSDKRDSSYEDEQENIESVEDFIDKVTTDHEKSQKEQFERLNNFYADVASLCGIAAIVFMGTFFSPILATLSIVSSLKCDAHLKEDKGLAIRNAAGAFAGTFALIGFFLIITGY